MIRSTWKINAKPIDDLIAFSESFVPMVGDLVEQSYQAGADDLLDELRYYPAPPSNSTYVRTFTLKNGWIVGMDRTTEGARIVIENNVEYAPYVVGSLAQAVAAARAFQARVHQGRWPLANETVQFWFEDIKSDFDARFAKELSPFGTTTFTQRAFTR